jgi:hypothetical protein
LLVYLHYLFLLQFLPIQSNYCSFSFYIHDLKNEKEQ